MSEHGGIGAMASGEAYGLGWQPTIGGTNGTDRRSSNTGGGDGSGHNLVAVAQTKEKRGRNLSGQTTPQRQPSLHEENSTSTNPEQAQAGCLMCGDQVNAIVELEDGRIVEARIAKPGFHFDTLASGRVLVFSDARPGDHIEPTEALREGIIAIEVQK